jgi:hypothetical protein
MSPARPFPSLISDAQKRANRLAAIVADVPSKVRLFERVFRGEASPRAAIKAQCLECLAFNSDEIRNCTAPACPLYAYRPFQKREE